MNDTVKYKIREIRHKIDDHIDTVKSVKELADKCEMWFLYPFCCQHE